MGASFTAVTVTLKVSLVVWVPSLTLSVIVAVPVLSAAGVTLTVRFAPLPPKSMFALGTSVVLDDVADSVSEPAEVRSSPMRKGSAPVSLSSSTV